MNREFVPYELALKLKQLGFDEPCIATHGYLELYINTDHGHIKAPLYQQAFRWFREKYNIYAIIIPTITMHWTFKTMTVVEDMVEVPPYNHVDANDYNTHQEAELACLKKLVEIVELKSE